MHVSTVGIWPLQRALTPKDLSRPSANSSVRAATIEQPVHRRSYPETLGGTIKRNDSRIQTVPSIDHDTISDMLRDEPDLCIADGQPHIRSCKVVCNLYRILTGRYTAYMSFDYQTS